MIGLIEQPTQVLRALRTVREAPGITGKPAVRRLWLTREAAAQRLCVAADVEGEPMGIDAGVGVLTHNLNRSARARYRVRASRAEYPVVLRRFFPLALKDFGDRWVQPLTVLINYVHHSFNSYLVARLQLEATVEAFSTIFEKAAMRKEGSAALEAVLPKPKTARSLKRITDDRFLAEMAACVFRSGFVWKIIENKWPAFEEAFHEFDTMACAMLADEDLERLQANTAIVRHAAKIRSVRNNAQFVRAVKDEHESFANYVAAWPDDNFVGLWDELKRRGDRLGGQTGRYFLRFMGKDTPILSRDVVQALIEQGVVEKSPTSKKALLQVQEAFNTWRSESGRPHCQISRVLACSVDSQG